MPSKQKCSMIADPVERKKCLNYQGKYAKKGSPGAAQKSMGKKPMGSSSY